MDRQKAWNAIAWLFTVLWMAIVVAINAGCATTNMEYTGPNGETTVWSSRTLWKDIKDAEVDWGEFSAKLGGSSGSGNEKMIACMLAPQLEGCQ